MVGFVELVKTSSNDFVTIVVAVLRMQLPATRSSSLGLCAVDGLDASSKVGLEAGLQLAVGVAMIVTCASVSWAGSRVNARTAKGFAVCIPRRLCRCRQSAVPQRDGTRGSAEVSMSGRGRGYSADHSIYSLMSDGGDDDDGAGDTSDDGDDVVAEVVTRHTQLSPAFPVRATSPRPGIVRSRSLLQALTALPPKQAMSSRARLISAAVNFGLTMYRWDIWCVAPVVVVVNLVCGCDVPSTK